MSDKKSDLSSEDSFLSDEASDNISVGSSSEAASIISLENQSHVTKKIKCDHKFLHDNSIRNMSSHLQDKHNLYENKNKNQDHTVQQILKETLEQ
ncbi:23474_t:CDS:2, partial [Racocetra persica]